MSPSPAPGEESLLLEGSVPAGADELVSGLVSVGEGTVSVVLLFGSQLVQASPDRHSAFDLVVLVDSYGRFYRALSGAGHHKRSPALLRLLARVLPPNVIAFFPSGPDGPVGKSMILTVEDFRKALAPTARDHFLKGRMVQRVALLHARDSEFTASMERAVAEARADVLRWMGPYLAEPFTTRQYARRMLEVSYRGEVRPESRDRAGQVFEAQAAFLDKTFAHVLEGAEAEGRVLRERSGWRLAHPVGAGEALSIRLYFLSSKVRATARWFKHILTFNDWLTYIQRKVERHTGMKIEITPLERRFPLILLWPKVFRILRARPSSRPAVAGDPPSREG